MELRQMAHDSATKAQQSVDRLTESDPAKAIRRFSKLERVLAVLCLLIPLLLIAFDSGVIRDSISAYFDMDHNQMFYFPLTVAAMLFFVNGVLKHKHFYNVFLGAMLAGVILFNHDDASALHGLFALAFFGGNAVVILFSTGMSWTYKGLFVLGIALAMAGAFYFDWFTLFWAEWLSFVIIAAHYIVDSIQTSPYKAVARHHSRVV